MVDGGRKVRSSSPLACFQRQRYQIEFRCVVSAAEIREAFQHAIKVSREGSCQWPRPRVIPVRDVYPSPSTTYVPHCAILHRCSDDTGCCRSEALTCVPKHSHRVELSFYVSESLDYSLRDTYVHRCTYPVIHWSLRGETRSAICQDDA